MSTFSCRVLYPRIWLVILPLGTVVDGLSKWSQFSTFLYLCLSQYDFTVLESALGL